MTTIFIVIILIFIFIFFSKKKIEEKETMEDYISLAQLAKELSTTKNELEERLIQQNYIERKNRWIIPTRKAKDIGAIEKYNAKTKIKYTMFPKKIVQNIQLNDQTLKKKRDKSTQKEKIEKGIKYEEFIARFFREKGYIVWEHGKEKGRKDSSIDLFIKKDKFVYFVQCKNWEKWKINHKEVKATRTDVRSYLKENKTFWNLIKDYNMKILYITPKECLTKSAYTYIKENQDIVEYQVIPMKENIFSV